MLGTPGLGVNIQVPMQTSERVSFFFLTFNVYLCFQAIKAVTISIDFPRNSHEW